MLLDQRGHLVVGEPREIGADVGPPMTSMGGLASVSTCT